MTVNNKNNKRKGDDRSSSGFISSNRTTTTTAVVFSPRHNKSEAWAETKSRLDSIKSMMKSPSSSPSSGNKDSVLDEIENSICHGDSKVTEHLKNKLDTAGKVRKQLDEQMDAAATHLEDESAAINTLTEELLELKRHGDSVQEQTNTIQKQCQRLVQEIRQYEVEIDMISESLEVCRQHRKIQVPRLQQQISLYATMTGIQWDFEKQETENNYDLLAGKVNVPSEDTIRYFEIDRRDHNRFEVANRLWDMMDGITPSNGDDTTTTDETAYY